MEPNETFFVNLSSPSGATIADTQGQGTILSEELPALTLTINPASVAENAGAGAATGTVTRTGPTTAALTVNLASNDTTEGTVPATVTIAAGQASANFAVAAVDDAVFDGTQNVTVTASAAGLTSGTASVAVTDNELPALTVTVNPGQHRRKRRGRCGHGHRDPAGSDDFRRNGQSGERRHDRGHRTGDGHDPRRPEFRHLCRGRGGRCGYGRYANRRHYGFRRRLHLRHGKRAGYGQRAADVDGHDQSGQLSPRTPARVRPRAL